MPSYGTIKVEAEVIIRWDCIAILPNDDRAALVALEAEQCLNSITEKLKTESGIKIYPRFHFKKVVNP